MGYSEFELPELSFPPITMQNPPPLFSLDTYLDMAIENRPDLKKAVLSLYAAKLNKYLSFSAFSPEFYLTANLEYNFENGKVKQRLFKKSTYNDWHFFYGIRGKWNIFNGFSDFFKIKEMSAWENFELQQVEKTYLNIINEVKVAYANYRKDYEKANLYQESLTWVIEQRKLVEAEYWGGLATIDRLNEAQSITVEAESRLIVALINMKKSFIQLQAAVNSPELFPVTP